MVPEDSAESIAGPADRPNPPGDEKPTGRRALLWATAIVALIGLVFSILLTRLHYLTWTDPVYQASCALGERVNCQTVALSPHSFFLGAPISGWGLFAYPAYAALALWGLTRRRLHDRWPDGLLLAGALASVSAAAWLAWVAATVIRSACLFCVGLYAVNTLLLVLAVASVLRGRVSPFAAARGDLRALGRHGALGAVLVGAAAAVTLLVSTQWPRYWVSLSEWTELADLPTGTQADGSPWIGAEEPRLVIEEFTDYECPHCRRAHLRIRRLISERRDEVRLVHRHYPLDRRCNPKVRREFHVRACEFATFASCAGRQGMFWEANDALFSSMETHRAEEIALPALAIRLGLDAPALESCMASGANEPLVEADIREAIRLRIRGTPTYLANGELHVGAIDALELDAMLTPESLGWLDGGSETGDPAP